MKYTLGILGAGNMAEAIIKAVLNSGVLPASAMIVSDPQPGRREIFEKLGIVATDHNPSVIANSQQIMLAVKPQMLASLAAELATIDPTRQIVLSIMAGITCKKMTELVGKTLRIIRIMPNTPLIVGLGMSGIALGPGAKAGDEDLAVRIFKAAGEVVMVNETDIDAVTAVSGSGPAYLFYLAEAMSEAAKSLNLTPQAAELLTRQTLLGAAKLLTCSGEAPEVLRKKVTSPGGTTQAAIEHMESQQVRSHIVRAIQKAAERSRELGK